VHGEASLDHAIDAHDSRQTLAAEARKLRVVPTVADEIVRVFSRR